ncbi:MAG: aminotransferase class V-fold PLP-dependent enzyme, partial [Nocardioides sp.]
MRYLDHASSEPLHPVARETLLAALDQGYGDPVRLHGPGRNARLLLDNAREVVASVLGVRPDEVSFTSSGTAAVHQGVLGLLMGRRRVSTRLVHSAVEHSAVFAAGDWWGRHFGGTTHPVAVDSLGRVSVAELGTALEPPAGVVAVQSANLEVGTVQPLVEVASAAEAAGVPLFVDFAASAGRLDLPAGWSAAAASAHKWGGPAGVGLLLVRKGARWRAPFPTDDRADPRVSGFENVPAALAA